MKNVHTKAFAKQFFGKPKEPTFAEAESFVLGLSEKLSEDVVSKIIAKTRKTYTTNKEIYCYCKENGIEQDFDPYDNYDEEPNLFNQPKQTDYSTYNCMDDIEVNGRSGFVVSNDSENKVIVIEFDDTEEMETINYSDND